MQALLTSGALPPGLRAVNLAGEALAAPLAQAVLAACPAARLRNLYGPSEATTYATLAPLDASAALNPPIGRPIAGTQAYVLDPQQRPLPLGAVGELYLGGAGLARGYRHRPDLTAASFVPDPFSPTPGARLYRTGDRVRWDAAGQLHYLGRADQQVKLRGYRIELGEVEAALRAHPQLAEAAALVRPGPAGQPQLVAYVVPDVGQPVTDDALRAHLASRLPAYMLPSAWVRLAQLPRTRHGKLDRAALPAPALPGAMPAGVSAPRTPTEATLAAIWAEVLGLPAVGVTDNFFALGGHSLLATQVVVRAREALKVDLPLRAIFQAPSVAELAALLATYPTTAGVAPEAPITPAARDQELPLSFAQERLWFLHQLQPASPAYHIPMAVRLRGPLDPAALNASLNQIIARHEALRTTFAQRDGRPLQVVAPSLTLTLTLVDLVGLPASAREAERERLAHAAALAPFDLAAGPLLRALLLRLDEREHVLLLTLHHIITDGWSQGVLVRELTTLYAALTGGPAAELPALAVQYADYAVWQRAWLRDAARERLLAYWRAQLADLPTLTLPTDRPRPPLQTFSGAHEPLQLAPELSAALAALARETGATLFMTLLAAFKVLLLRYSGQSDLAVGTPIAGRVAREPGAADRLLRQHPGAAHRPGRQSELPRAAGARARDHPRRLRPPGSALRAAGR